MPTMTVKEKPILFSSEMVKAILDNRKSQTRRIVKPQPNWLLPDHRIEWSYCSLTRMFCAADRLDISGHGTLDAWRCPYEVGMRPWVRETFDYVAGTVRDQWEVKRFERLIYRADGCQKVSKKWTPPIHMPRWASRLTLEITEVRVERIQDIGRDGRKAGDVLAEGITPAQIEHERKWFHPDDSPAIAFSRLWESANGKGSWARNDWVWAIRFRKVS